MNLQIQKMYQNESLSVMSNMSTIQQLFSLLVICFFVCFTYTYNVQRTLNYDKKWILYIYNSIKNKTHHTMKFNCTKHRICTRGVIVKTRCLCSNCKQGYTMITWLYFNVSHPLGMLCRTETLNFSFNPTKYDTIVLRTTYNCGNMIYMSDKSIFQDFWQQKKSSR